MKIDINTNLIKKLLDTSASQLSSDTLDKLRIARTRALDHQRVRHSVPVLAWLGHHTDKHDSFNISKPMNWAVAALLVACLISGASIWQSYTSENEINEMDIAILTGDLPIHVYVD